MEEDALKSKFMSSASYKSRIRDDLQSELCVARIDDVRSQMFRTCSSPVERLCSSI